MNQLRDIFGLEPDTKRRFNVDEFERMGMAGIFGPDERVELIAGEIYRMSPAGRSHEVLRVQLAYQWSRMAAPSICVAAEMQLRLRNDYQPVTDIGVWPMAILAPDARGPDMLLVVEIADSSLGWDTQTKAAAYAAGGVRDYWVINAHTRETIIHRDPGPTGYGSKTEIPADSAITPLLVPELTVRLADLPSA